MLQSKDTGCQNGLKKKQDPSICCLEETDYRYKDTCRLKVRGWRNIYHSNGCQKKPEYQYLYQTLDLKSKTIKRDEEGHNILIKGSTQQEDLIIVNIYAHNLGVPTSIKQLITNIRELIDNNTIIIGDINIPLAPMDRSSKQKINKETKVLNDTMDQMDLTHIVRTFHPKATEYTFFSSAHGTVSRIDHILDINSALSKYKKKDGDHPMHSFRPWCYET